jgi:hypothetical protein
VPNQRSMVGGVTANFCFPRNCWVKALFLSLIHRENRKQFTYMTPNKRVRKLPTSTQPRETWHTDSLDMVVLPSNGASRYHKCCVDGGSSSEYFGLTSYYTIYKYIFFLSVVLTLFALQWNMIRKHYFRTQRFSMSALHYKPEGRMFDSR